jgi:hypothetical protein
MHARLEAATLAMQHGWPAGAEGLEELAIAPLEDSRVQAAPVAVPRPAGGVAAAHGCRTDRAGGAAVVHKTTGAVKALPHRGLASLARLLGLRGPQEPPGPPHPSPDPAQPRSQEVAGRVSRRSPRQPHNGSTACSVPSLVASQTPLPPIRGPHLPFCSAYSFRNCVPLPTHIYCSSTYTPHREPIRQHSGICDAGNGRRSR